MKIAQYKDLDYSFISIEAVTDYYEEADDKVRLSEPIDVEFTDLPAIEVLQPQVDSIERKIEDERVRHTAAMQSLDEAKQKLLAIAHDPAHSERAQGERG